MNSYLQNPNIPDDRPRGRLDFPAINSAARPLLASLAQAWLPDGRMRGTEWVCRNPHRADRRLGSLTINTRSGIWRDFATGDGGSDPISLYAFAHGVGQGEAARALASMFGIDAGRDWVPGPRPAPKPQPPAWTTTTKPESSRAALKMWRGGIAMRGTIGDAYFKGRAIAIDPGPWCRFHRDLPYWHPGIGKDDPPRLLNRGPAILLAAHYGDDLDIVAVHRIYLGDDARKLMLPDPDEPGETLDAKKIRNRFRGAHLKLGQWPDHPGGGIEVVASEGPENCLSLCQGLGLPGLCSISSANMAIMRLPPSVKSVVIGGDNDPAGHAAVEKSRISYAEQGASVRAIFPPEGDWNDTLQRDEGISI